MGCVVLSGAVGAANSNSLLTNTVPTVNSILTTDVIATPSGGTVKSGTTITLKMTGIATNAIISYKWGLVPYYFLYTGPITLTGSGTNTLSFYATYNGIQLQGQPPVTYKTAVHQATYTWDDTVPWVTPNPVGGTYNSGQYVSLTMSEPGNIYYALNGGIQQTYTSPILISSTTKLDYYGIDKAGWISSPHSQSYIINDNTAPKVSSTTPKNNQRLVSRKSAIVVKFSEGIMGSSNYNKIAVKNLKTGKNVKITKSISTNKLTIKTTSTRKSKTWYQVTIPKSAIRDYSGNLNSKYVFKFKTKK